MGDAFSPDFVSPVAAGFVTVRAPMTDAEVAACHAGFDVGRFRQ
jgi:hypothetical protein